ncbi:MAG: hypothetical protein K2V38_04990, partial [Gemmataceae bacterium]|nr:hypothetical protein [Gemmataceae bacterium]
ATAARSKYSGAVKFLCSADVYPAYRDLITAQARARIADEVADGLKACGNDGKTLVNALEPFLKSNPAFVKEMAQVDELRKAVLADPEARQQMSGELKADPEHRKQMSGELKADPEHRKAVLDDTSDEELERILAERKANKKPKPAS